MDLTKFCRPDDVRDICRRPHTDGEFVYATNGHYAVRVNAADYSGDAPLMDDTKSMNTLHNFFSNIESKTFTAFPSFIVPELVTCGVCGGAGTVCECPECLGTGEDICRCCGGYVDCDNCSGDGHIEGDDESCRECFGEGEVPVNRDWSVPFGSSLANFRYLQLFQSLPNVEASISQFDESPIRFRFDGGYGVLMPIRK